MLDKSYRTPACALQQIVDALSGTQPAIEPVAIEYSYGRVLAQDITAPEDLPGFARSTVDGYAVRAADTYGAKETAPAYLEMDGEVFMGEKPGFSLKAGRAAKIPTGGMLPEGADAVVMLEYTQTVSDSMVEVMKAAGPGDNVIRGDEDVRAGMPVLSRGRRLRPQDVGALAGLGITHAGVYRRPIVSLISTGDEIVPHSEKPRPGQVRDINSFTLDGLISEEGGRVRKEGIFRDDYDLIAGALRRSLAFSDMVIIIGGTSAGTKDMTSTIIDDAGTPGVLFHGLSLKPGKPLIGAVVEGKPVLGLPGHPAAAVVCFELFIKPLIGRLSGLADSPHPATLKARMARSIASAAGREDHIRVALEERDGEFLAVPVLGKSGLITTLVRADGTVVIPSEALGLDQGDDVTVYLF